MCSHHRINQMTFEKHRMYTINQMAEVFNCIDAIFKLILKVTNDHSLTFLLNNPSIGVKLYGEL